MGTDYFINHIMSVEYVQRIIAWVNDTRNRSKLIQNEIA